MEQVKNNKLFLFYIFLFFNCMYAQELKPQKNGLEFINNKIKYSVVRLSCKEKNGMAHTIVGKKIIVNLSNKQLDKLNKLTCKQWMNLLRDEKSDWATNVILYYLNEKSALPYFDGKRSKPKEWVGIFKEEDIKMWEAKICGSSRLMWVIPTCDDYIKM
jgi:hypothetical protein